MDTSDWEMIHEALYPLYIYQVCACTGVFVRLSGKVLSVKIFKLYCKDLIDQDFRKSWALHLDFLSVIHFFLGI